MNILFEKKKKKCDFNHPIISHLMNWFSCLQKEGWKQNKLIFGKGLKIIKQRISFLN